MSSHFFLVFLVMLLSLQIDPALPPRFVIWNVGQGLWMTVVTGNSCSHIDMGGEKWNPERLLRECAGKTNDVRFSHWDQDHIGFARKAAAVLGQLCISVPPAGPHKKKKENFLAALKACPTDQRHGPRADNTLFSHAVSSYAVSPYAVSSYTPSLSSDAKHINPIYEIPHKPAANHKQPNDFSRIFQFGSFLLPGDSTSAEEKIWRHNLNAGRVHILIAGHHGSRTSTSYALLETLKNLKVAVMSARHSRYGHPHRDVLKKLKNAGVSVLLTEDWNNIIFELKPSH